ncbi:MAG: TauD/TfdA family dioxygenase, partial [Pseudomonadales bacterium]|nr:TauD/TfdA family dioxygenase [Pseudomonadales bacterium]
MTQVRSRSVENITPSLGGVVSGIDLANLSAEDEAFIRQAFKDRLVLVFRDQQLTREQHKTFGRLFGELHLHPAKTHLGMPGDPEIFDIRINAKTKVTNGEAWHT